ncbi:GNAT family N-acetyltransferase [Rhodoferax sp.]|uniref:GNAT family N-acetyltransferase n=1 Tax=Rhodoferax sp. TaxID=50421 RepID=UPI00260458EF|nr:GNAT family N-acetyltransferase [Rhodoferax sp.]MDD2809381.1 GNAT family N-acetyltransferase [Rhodoferax sp.]
MEPAVRPSRYLIKSKGKPITKGERAHPDSFTSSVAERGDLPLSWWEGRLTEGTIASEMVFGAFIHDELAGVAGLSFEVREKAKHKVRLFGMYVRDSFQKQGLGRKLIDEVICQARSCSDTKIIQLTVTAGNAPAQRLYESSGFVPFGIEPFAVRVGAAYVSKVHMWCNLSLLVGSSVGLSETGKSRLSESRYK